MIFRNYFTLSREGRRESIKAIDLHAEGNRNVSFCFVLCPQVKILNLMAGEHMTEDFLKINPQHTVPTLVDDDYVLWESKAIATYLVEQHRPDSALYPSDPRKRGLINRMLYFDSTVLFARAFAAIGPVMRAGAKSIPQERKDAIGEALSTLNGFLEGQDWVTGEDCTVADLCLLASVSSLEVREIFTVGGLHEWKFKFELPFSSCRNWAPT